MAVIWQFARIYKPCKRLKSYKGGRAIDGDTFRYKGQRYRVQQYNAPELGQPGAKKATRDLQRKLAFADIIETDRMHKWGRGQNKKRCKFSERD